MLSTVDLERLIAVKRLEIEKEKILLGLASPESGGNVSYLYYCVCGNLLIVCAGGRCVSIF